MQTEINYKEKFKIKKTLLKDEIKNKKNKKKEKKGTK